jgi:hypothetical protein
MEKFLIRMIVGSREETLLRLVSNQQYFLETLFKLDENKWSESRCVFVLSTGRTGTMQLAALLNLSKDIEAMHEPSPVLLKAGYDAYFERCDNNKWGFLIHGARDELIAFANHNKKIYVETNNRLTYLSSAIALCYPCSKFIHLHRHPLEVIRSGMNRKWYSGGQLDNFRLRPREGDEFEDKWDSLSAIEKNAWLWARINVDSQKFINSLPENRGFELRADHIFEANIEKISDLYSFIEAAMPQEPKIKKTLKKKINAQKKMKFPKYNNWTEKEKTAVKKIVFPVAQILGYRI